MTGRALAIEAAEARNVLITLAIPVPIILAAVAEGRCRRRRSDRGDRGVVRGVVGGVGGVGLSTAAARDGDGGGDRRCSDRGGERRAKLGALTAQPLDLGFARLERLVRRLDLQLYAGEQPCR